jgi:anti-sigma B factor antagonist
MTSATPQRGQGWYAATPFRSETERPAPGVLILRLVGDIDIATAEAAVAAIRRHVGPPASIVLLELSGVTFCSSSGLRVLVEAARLADEHGIDLRLVGAGRPVQRPMDVTGLGAHFLSFTSVTAALAYNRPLA